MGTLLAAVTSAGKDATGVVVLIDVTPAGVGRLSAEARMGFLDAVAAIMTRGACVEHFTAAARREIVERHAATDGTAPAGAAAASAADADAWAAFASRVAANLHIVLLASHADPIFGMAIRTSPALLRNAYVDYCAAWDADVVTTIAQARLRVAAENIDASAHFNLEATATACAAMHVRRLDVCARRMLGLVTICVVGACRKLLLLRLSPRFLKQSKQSQFRHVSWMTILGQSRTC